MPSKLLSILFALFVTVCIDVFGIHQGNIIIVYGTSCSGKSTLALQLEQELTGQYQIVKKTPLIKQKRAEFIEKMTGIQPQNPSEIVNSIVTMPRIYREDIHEINREAIFETINTIKNLSDQGNNVIFDICIKGIDPFKEFEGYPVFTILVYAPPRKLLEREQGRTNLSQRSVILQQRAQNLLLSGLQVYYKPVPDNTREFIDEISYEDIIAFYPEKQPDTWHYNLQRKTRKTIRYFGLDKKRRVRIVPTTTPDIFINSSKNSIADSVEIVRNFLKKHEGQEVHYNHNKIADLKQHFGSAG